MKTKLGKKLATIRNRAISKGMKLLSRDEVLREAEKRRK